MSDDPCACIAGLRLQNVPVEVPCDNCPDGEARAQQAPAASADDLIHRLADALDRFSMEWCFTVADAALVAEARGRPTHRQGFSQGPHVRRPDRAEIGDTTTDTTEPGGW